MTDLRTSLELAAQRIAQANALFITAGAGMGVDSGLPDYRGDEGFWNSYPAIGSLGLSFAELANPYWFTDRPALAWGFYGHRLRLYRETLPHPGFEILLRWIRRMPLGGFVFTSNVDGQFQKAGFDADQIVECHGSIHRLQCTEPCSSAVWDAKDTHLEIDEAQCLATGPLPVCPNCGATARPNIYLFSDFSWNQRVCDAQKRRLEAWIETVHNTEFKVVVVEMGAGQAIPTVRLASEVMAERFAGTLIRINPRESGCLDDVRGISLPMGALEGLREIERRLD